MRIETFVENASVVVLTTAGHNGIDWVHSLLDGHSQIIMTPAFSFMRSIEHLRLKQRGAKQYLLDLISHPTYLNDRRRFFDTLEEMEAFSDEAYLQFQALAVRGLNTIASLFYAIHFAYAKLKQPTMTEFPTIIVHEHVPWLAQNYIDQIGDCKFIVVMRDPRPALVGSWIRLRRAPPEGRLTAYQYDHSWLYWLSACENLRSWHKNGVSYFIVKNENLHDDMTVELEKLFEFLELSVEPAQKAQTIGGRVWFGESVYLAVDNLSKPPPDDYYDNKNIEKRWRSNISWQENLTIEVLLRDVFRSYYAERPTKSLPMKLLAYLFYFQNFWNLGGNKRYKFFWPLVCFRNLLRRLLVLLAPNFSARFFRIL